MALKTATLTIGTGKSVVLYEITEGTANRGKKRTLGAGSHRVYIDQVKESGKNAETWLIYANGRGTEYGVPEANVKKYDGGGYSTK